MTYLRIIGDVHGYINAWPYRTYGHEGCLLRNYLQLIDDCEYTIQLGDLGIGKCLQHVKNVDNKKHVVILGNHDDYSNSVHLSLGNYGYVNHGGLDFFFVRGEESIDKQYRTEYVDWWRDEQLPLNQAEECLDLYENIKPNIVMSHGCPSFLYEHGVLTNFAKKTPSFTSQLLNMMYNIHKPKIWLFAHHHNFFRKQIDNTLFTCINELCYIDVDEFGNSDWKVK